MQIFYRLAIQRKFNLPLLASPFDQGLKRGNKSSIVIGQWSKKITDDQSNLLFSNQAHALDGAIDGAIFPWLRDTRAFVLLNHL